MKKFLFLTIALFFVLGVSAQNYSEASIDNNCNSKPATLSIPQGKTASGFVMQSLVSGNNCQSGAHFIERGFIIKNSSGNQVFRYTINAKGQVYEPNGKLSQLKLSAGIYYVYVDGGRGAYLKLKYNL